MAKEGIILPEDGDDGGIFFDPTIRELTERSDIDHHQNIKADDLGEPLGEGFFINPEPVLVQRGPDGGIVRTTPLSEIPGVEMHGAGTERTDNEDKAKPVPMSRDERRKLVDSLALRLYNYYKNLPPNSDKWNPFTDGIPEIADADPLNLSPRKSEAIRMVNASDTDVFLWLRKFVGARAQIIDKKRGFGDARDLALRISRNPD